MSRESPTLADALIREWLRPQYRRLEREPGWLARTTASARKFVLDERMSEFLGDLAYASLATCRDTAKAHLLTDTMRQAARLPHPVTFIEYDMEAKKRRVRAEYGADPRFHLWADHEHGPKRCGWLLLQHPQVDTAFMAVECASHAYDGSSSALSNTPQASPLAYAWRVDEGAPPWPEMPWPLPLPRLDIGRRATPEAMLTGIPTYRSESVRLIYPPHMRNDLTDLYHRSCADGRGYNMLSELASDARYLWALLSTINDLPTRVAEVRPDRGYVARGSYRRFVEHRVITLTVPASAYRRLAMRAVAVARRRRHAVRGHWRIDYRHRLSPLCDHEFRTEADTMRCARCGGQRLWIAEHERGDASLGFVLHDYKVERGEAR